MSELVYYNEPHCWLLGRFNVETHQMVNPIGVFLESDIGLTFMGSDGTWSNLGRLGWVSDSDDEYYYRLQPVPFTSFPWDVTFTEGDRSE